MFKNTDSNGKFKIQIPKDIITINGIYYFKMEWFTNDIWYCKIKFEHNITECEELHYKFIEIDSLYKIINTERDYTYLNGTYINSYVETNICRNWNE